MARLPDAAGQAGHVEDAKNVKELRDMPVRVLRGFFSGVGQLLLAADRLRAENARSERTSPEETEGPTGGLDGEAAEPSSSAGAPPESEAASASAGRHRQPTDAKTESQSVAAQPAASQAPVDQTAASQAPGEKRA